MTDTDWPSSPRRGQAIDAVVLHSIVGPTTPEALARLRAAGVSAHLVIGSDGDVHRLVPYPRAAWHAGGGRLPPEAGSEPINRRSIGIELVVASVRGAEYPEAQVRALERELDAISYAHDIAWLATHEAVDRRRTKPRPAGDPLRTDPWRLPDDVWRRALSVLATPVSVAEGDR